MLPHSFPHQYGRRTDEHMGRCELVPFHSLGPRLLVKFPRVGKAIEVKCPTYALSPPSGLTLIDALPDICGNCRSRHLTYNCTDTH